MLKVILGFYMVCVGSSTVLAMVFTEHETQKFSAVPCRGVTVLSVLKEVQPRLNHDVVEALLKKDPSKLCDAARALVRQLKETHNAKMKEEQRKAIAAAGMEREEGAAAGPSPRHLGRDAHMAKMQKEQQEANAAARSQKEADDQE